MRKVYLLLIVSIIDLCAIAQFTPGNIVVVRVFDGSNLSNIATSVFVDEYTTSGTFVQTVTIPSSVAGNRLTMAGTSTSEGLINLSQDGKYLFIAGYDAAAGTTGAVAQTTVATTNRVVGRIDFNENIDLTTKINDGYNGTTGNNGNIRSAISSDGMGIWTSGTSNGSTGGIRYVTLGNSGTSIQLNSTFTNSRGLNIFSDQLYASFGAGTQRGPNIIGSGLPTTSSQTFTLFPGFTVGATGSPTNSPYQFLLFDVDANIPGPDLLYIADDDISTTNGLWKLTYDGTVWTARGHLLGRITGLTGFRDCSGGVNLFVSSGLTTSNNLVYKIVDNSAFLGQITGDGTSILVPGNVFIPAVGSTTAFRGLAMVPAQGYTVTGTQSVPAGNYNVIRVKNGGTATLTGNIVVYDKIVVENGGTLDMAGFTITSPLGIGSSFGVQSGGRIKIGSSDGITATTALGNVQTCFRTYNGGANYEYTGSIAQSTGDGLPTNISGSLKINNSSGIATTGVTLSQSTSISGSLDLTAAKLTTTASNLLTLNYSATSVTNASSVSFISGPVKKIGNNPFVFPVGVGSIYAPLGIINISGELPTDEFTAEYKRTNPQNVHGTVVQTTPVLMDHVSYVEYWTLTQNIGSATKKVSLAVNPESFCKVLASTYVSRWNGSFWTSEGSTNGGVTSIPPFEIGTITSVNNLSAFGDFTLITELPFATNPLPIKLISFNGLKLNNYRSILNWELATCCSRDAKFEIQRSADGINFSLIGSITGSETNRFYNFHDNDLQKGINYYRLKGIDVDGKISYSKVVAIINDASGLLLTTIAPNPVQDNMTVTLSAAKAATVRFVISDIAGRPVKQWSAPIAEGSNSIPINAAGLAAGIYHLGAITGDSKTVIRFVKQ